MAVEWAEQALKFVFAASVLLMVVKYFAQGPLKPGSDDDSFDIDKEPCRTLEMLSFRARLFAISPPLEGLRGVTFIVRHGDRSQLLVVDEEREFWKDTLPLDAEQYFPIPYRLEQRELVNFPFGRLTQKGVCQMYELGRWARERYQSILAGLEEPQKAVRFYSTDYERTARSSSVIARAIGYVNSEIVVLPREHDPLDPWESIPSFSQAVYDFEAKNTTFQNLVKESSGAAREVYNLLQGKYFKTERSFAWITAYDLLVCAENHPDQSRILDQIVRSPIKEVVHGVTLAQFACLYRDPALRRLAVGGLLGGLGNWVATKANSTVARVTTSSDLPIFHIDPSVQLAVVAVHDTNLLPLKMALGWEDPPTWPQYASFLAVEVYDGFVRIVDSNSKTKQMSAKAFMEMCNAN